MLMCIQFSFGRQVTVELPKCRFFITFLTIR